MFSFKNFIFLNETFWTLCPRKKIQNSEIQNMLITEDVYVSHCVCKLHFF